MIRYLLLTTTLLALAASVPTSSAKDRHASLLDANGNLDAMIASQAAANNVPVELVRRVIKRESGGNPRIISKGNYGLMQIKLATARAMGYRGGAAGLLDANTNMTYAVKYLAGAYRAAGGNADRTMHYYASGYYYAAKRKGITGTKTASVRVKDKLHGARSSEMSAASSSNPYTGRPNFY